VRVSPNRRLRSPEQAGHLTALAGAMSYGGIITPPPQMSTREYFTEKDPLLRWVSAC